MEISIVVPAYNEKENMSPFLEEVEDVVSKLDKEYEIIVIDDGSTDGSYQELAHLSEKYSGLRVLKLRKNFGQTAALALGFAKAQGKIVVVMDADMQNDPHDIPALLRKLREGYDVVSGWRHQRKDPFGKKIVSWGANLLRKMITREKIHDSGCSLKAYKAACLKGLDLYGEMHRFIPLLLLWKGYKIGELKVNHRGRTRGKTKYGILRVLKGFLDLMTIKFWMQYSNRPMHLFGGLGVGSFAVGFVIGLYLVALKFFEGVSLSNRPLLLLAMLLMILGIQLFGLGILADIMVKHYFRGEDQASRIEKEL